MTNNEPTVRLATIAHSCAAFADDLRAQRAPRPTADERHARGCLIALEMAILHGSLDTLIAAIAPWMRAEVERVDALLNGPAHDRLSAAVGQMGMVGADLDDAAALDLPDAYTGLG